MSEQPTTLTFLRNSRAGGREALVDFRHNRKSNVTLMYSHILLFTIYQSICQWNLFDAYLSLLARENGFVNANTWVGFAEGIMGITTLVLAMPLGILVDSYDRIKLVKITGFVGLVASAISAYALSKDHLATLYTNLCLWGLFVGLQATAAEAVFADSTDKGSRSKQFTTKGMLNTAGLSLGPLLAIFLFVIVGDEWRLSQLHLPLLIGCCFGPLCCIPLFFMKDPNPPPILDSDNRLTRCQKPFLPNPVKTPLMVPASPMLRRDRIGSHCSDFSNPECDDSPTLLNERLETPLSTPRRSAISEEQRFKNMSRGERCIPYALTTADFITEVGAGMTVRFFPLFFIADYQVSPVQLCIIFCFYPLCVAIGMPLCHKLANGVGRAQASFIFQSLGICALLLMTYLDNLPFLIVVFMLRGSLQNAAYPIDRSILTDFTPSKHRGKWNSIASLTTMTWSGSAVLGGYLVDRHDYRFTFLITAGIYVIGVLFYMPLLWWVPRKENEGPKSPATQRPTTLSYGFDIPISKVDESPGGTVTTEASGFEIAGGELNKVEEGVENKGENLTEGEKKMA